MAWIPVEVPDGNYCNRVHKTCRLFKLGDRDGPPSCYLFGDLESGIPMGMKNIETHFGKGSRPVCKHRDCMKNTLRKETFFTPDVL